ncbi:type VI secretion system baseplate subunit TssF [Stenotrophomonas maltophilia]|uniref:type VI secretion system baseplate subunit TssF n=1 Tax=Stenotrophomonas TaxID=40323 RepID=UPI000DA9D582|nr:MULTISPECIES: type VI secretion system baseplate subunit TssF [Stenotrophomonas]MBH1665105.1 type VI secretion system baseplate subunit TssF [Stenotrophomonas maltophilia]MCU1021868.1 type VI secretion system baseplate subunit TssF [Stenotrophomonas maltophilia]MCU1091592.1 type VI secretion system baseplate subunit TssF [Stenotrophomonas maltophilia]MDH0172846.1 type VI secretion system baseplate subunit TssF [Stenotrophomonas sp. GD04145]PZT33773.1 type VI secretion protein [Stenotrophomo
MQDLLPYYERELAYLRRYGREFAERYPKIAGRLQLSAEGSQDPHVERLIEAFALLSARVSKRIEDDYPEFTDALLDVLYPHYLRPFPSCSIAHFDMEGVASKLSAPVRVPRGTALQSRPVRGVPCDFRTAYDVVLAPIGVQQVVYRSVADAPMATTLPAGTGGQISLGFQLLSDQLGFGQLGTDQLRLFLDGEPSVRAALRDALMLGVKAAYVESDGDGRWRRLEKVPLSPVGFAEDEALIDFPARSHPAYRLLTELFAYPEKFGFVDLHLPTVTAGASRRFTLHLVLHAQGQDRGNTMVLEELGTHNVRLGCTPIVNLFRTSGEPIRVTHRTVNYPVLADARRAFAYEVHSIDSVHRIRQTPQGELIQAFRPFYSLHHGEDPERTGQYWVARRDEDVARQSPGFETEISFVDLSFNPVLPQTDTVSLELTCSNRDLPNQLAFGVAGGDLNIEGGSPARAISLLRKPTKPLRFRHGRNAQWRLISHLSLNQLSLTASGLPALKEMLRLYDLSGSNVSARQIDGILELQQTPTTTWMHGRQFASVVRGLEIRLTINEAHFVGTGVAAFAQVMDHFFALYVHANSFTRLVLVSGDSGEEIVRCPARSGESILA